MCLCDLLECLIYVDVAQLKKKKNQLVFANITSFYEC